MARPHIIIHTHTSLDGNINAGSEPASQKYQDIALRPGLQQFGIDAYLNGKTSTIDNITGRSVPQIDDDAQVPAGEHEVDYQVLLEKLHDLGIERLMVGGGGAINWSFLQQGLVDEVSVVLAPVANADPEAPRFFTAREPYSTIDLREFELTGLEDLGDSVVWLRYVPR